VANGSCYLNSIRKVLLVFFSLSLPASHMGMNE
jgi:hypothetical protein